MNEDLLKKINESINYKGIVISFEKLISLKDTVVTISTMVIERAPDSTH